MKSRTFNEFLAPTVLMVSLLTILAYLMFVPFEAINAMRETLISRVGVTFFSLIILYFFCLLFEMYQEHKRNIEWFRKKLREGREHDRYTRD